VRYGDADVMVAGGAEAVVTELAVGGFASARALSTRNDDPATASRPWDKERDGFVLGEGAGAVVLEEYQHAKARGANIYCEVLGYGASADAFHMTAPPQDGDGGFRAMRNAVRVELRASPALAALIIVAHGAAASAAYAAAPGAMTALLGAMLLVLGIAAAWSRALLGNPGSIRAIEIGAEQPIVELAGGERF